MELWRKVRAEGEGFLAALAARRGSPDPAETCERRSPERGTVRRPATTGGSISQLTLAARLGYPVNQESDLARISHSAKKRTAFLSHKLLFNDNLG